MSFTDETTHYSIPLPLGTDLTTPMDYNEAAQAVDTALFGAVQDSATATADAAEAKSTAQGAVSDVTALAGRVSGVEATVATQGTSITRNANAIADTKQDLMDSICSIEEASATASVAHAVDTYFWYNDTLYITTVPIAIGDTIVPNTNCETTNVTAELLKIDIPDIGSLNTRVTNVEGQLKASNATAGVTDVPFRFGCDDNGNYGYILTEGGADTVIPFSSGSSFEFDCGAVCSGTGGRIWNGTTAGALNAPPTGYTYDFTTKLVGSTSAVTGYTFDCATGTITPFTGVQSFALPEYGMALWNID